MKLTVLGSGTCIPFPVRNAPGYLLEAAGLRLLFDCGSGTARQLAKVKVTCESLAGIFLTHFHPDHCSDLVAIVQARQVGGGGRAGERLTIGGPRAIGEYYRSCVGPWLSVGFPVKLLEMKRPLDFDGVRIDCSDTWHLGDGESLAYRFAYQEKFIVLTGDAPYSKSLATFAAQTDLLVADCSSLETDRREGHMSARQCGILAREAGVKTILLSHLYPASYPDEERLEECRSEFDGEVLLAEDFMELRP